MATDRKPRSAPNGTVLADGSGSTDRPTATSGSASTDRRTRLVTRIGNGVGMIRRIVLGPDPEVAQLQELLDSRELTRILVRHAQRGLRLQFLLRVLLIAFMM